MTQFELRDRRLRLLYDRSPRMVAYLDETSRVGRIGEADFYVMTAVVFDYAIADDVRDTLLRICGSDYWHSTDAYRTLAGRTTLTEFVDYLGYDEEVFMLCVVHAALSDFSGDLEVARRHCFEEMVRVLDADHNIDLVVYERRRAGAEEDADYATVDGLRKRHATRDIRFHDGTPSSEPLLWAPDILASVLRRRLALKEPAWFEPLREKAGIYDARTGKRTFLNGKTP